MTRAIILSIAIFLCLPFSSAWGEDVQDHLNATYKNKIYILRHAITKESQHYDAAGQLLDSAAEGSWTLYGALEIKSLTLSSNQLRLTANRLVYTYDQGKKDLVPRKIKWDKAKVTLDVALSHPVTTIDEADSLLHRIFVSSESELIETVPDYWRPFLQKQTSTTPPPGALTEIKKDSPEAIERINPPTVTAPKPVYTPAPEYSDLARKFGMQGTVVLEAIIDKTGAVIQPEILRPVGFGLDEQAITKVRTWKFKPAMRDGKPVAVKMALEVAYNLGKTW
jgi:TonB family protein